MSTIEQEDALVEAMADRMLKKLRANAWKPHWSHCTFRFLIARLRGETGEISQAWRSRKRAEISPEEAERIADECADVANFAAMIAEMALTRARKAKR